MKDNFNNNFLYFDFDTKLRQRVILCKTYHHLHRWCSDPHVCSGRLFFTSLWLDCHLAALSDGSDAPALALQLNSDVSGRDTDILPTKRQTRGHLLNSREVWLGAPFRSHLVMRQPCQQTHFFTLPPPGQHCMTHFLGKMETNAAQCPVTTVKACFFSWSRGDTTDHVVCDERSETNWAWVWAELRMWHAVICSDDVGVGNVGGGNSRGGHRSDSCLFIRCFFFPPRWSDH